MTEIAITGTGGGPEVLVPRTAPLPVPGPGEVLVQVAAAGVNRPDVLQRAGGYPPPPGAPLTPGLEIAGTVVAVGTGVAEDRIGQDVCALVAGGGYARFALAADALALPVPAGLSLIEAAAVPETYFTVWDNVFRRGALVAGETLLVHGGSSGIGTTAVQLAVALGAQVLATVGSADKAAAVEALGARKAINYRTEDFLDAVKAETDGGGVDVILDIVGASYLERNLKALAVDGRLVIIGWMGGAVAEKVNLGPLLPRRLTVTGSTLRPRTVAQKAEIARSLVQTVWPLLAAGTVKPLIYQTFPLEQAAAAHAAMEAGDHIGKLVLTVG